MFIVKFLLDICSQEFHQHHHACNQQVPEKDTYDGSENIYMYIYHEYFYMNLLLLLDSKRLLP